MRQGVWTRMSTLIIYCLALLLIVLLIKRYVVDAGTDIPFSDLPSTAGSAQSEALGTCEAAGGFCAQSCAENYIRLDLRCPEEIGRCCRRSTLSPVLKIVSGDLFP